jgi:hypothetical protein
LLENLPKPPPNDLLKFADDLNGQLHDVAERILKLLAWRCGSSLGHNPEYLN